MHFAQILPGRGLFSRIRRKRDACGAILASHGSVVAATRGTGTRVARGERNVDGDAGGARWARYGRGARRDGNDADGGARWARCRCGQKGAQRGGRDAYRVLDGDDPDSDSWPDRRRCRGLLRLVGRQGPSYGAGIVRHWHQPSSGTSVVVRACRFPVQAALDVELSSMAVLSSSASHQSSGGVRCPISSVRSAVACQPVLQVMRRAFATVVHRRLISGCSGTVVVGDGCAKEG